MRIEQKVTKRKRIIVRLFVVSLLLSSLFFIKLLLNRMNKYIDENGCSFEQACEDLGIDETQLSSEKDEYEMY